MIEYKCPYCGQNSYKDKTKGVFTSWSAISRHVSKCTMNTHDIIIDKLHGPITVSEINSTPIKVLKNKYKGLKLAELTRTVRRNGISIKNITDATSFNKENIILLLQQYFSEFNRVPSTRDLDTTSSNIYPSTATLRKYFGSFNNAIVAAGLEPTIQNGYGTDTIGKDGHLYRSKSEAYFSDSYLFNIYKYVVEPKYESPYGYWSYDWYISDLNLYIELDGGIRPYRIEEKINLNKFLNKRCLFLKTSEIYNYEVTCSKIKEYGS